jgi:endonuclease III
MSGYKNRYSELKQAFEENKGNMNREDLENFAHHLLLSAENTDEASTTANQLLYDVMRTAHKQAVDEIQNLLFISTNLNEQQKKHIKKALHILGFKEEKDGKN